MQDVEGFGDTVIVTYREVATGRESGVEIEGQGCEVWQFDDSGLPVRMDNYAGRAHALAAASVAG